MHNESLQVMHVISNLQDGGAEGALYRLCVSTPHHKHQVVCMMDEGKYGPLLKAAGVAVHCLHMPQGQPTLGGVLRYWRLLRSQRPQVVQTWMYHADLLGGVLARLSGIRRVYWGLRHSNLDEGTVKRSTIGVAKICAFLSSFVPQRIISCSQQAVTTHVALGYDASKFAVIANGYDLSHFKPNLAVRERLRQEWRVKPDTFLLGMVARFDLQKDHANLLAALGLLNRSGCDFHCVLIGTGMDASNSQVNEWIAGEGLADRVSLLGRRNDIADVMGALDVHVLSSLGEAFPNVLAEAMACGTPCVTTDVGDAALIEGGTGWVVPPQSAQAVADALMAAFKAWLNKPVQWSARQVTVREHILQNFQLDQMCAAYEAVWQES